MYLRQLRTFLVVARHGNMTRAAADVHLAQSSVSDQIQALEAEMGTPLFARSRLGLTLTEAGRALLPHAEAILRAEQEARAAVRAAAAITPRSVTLGTLETVASTRLAALLPAFQRAHPDIKMRLVVGASGELHRQLHDGNCDLLMLFGHGQSGRPVGTRRFSHEPMVLVGSPDRAREGAALTFSDLLREPFLATERGCLYRRLFDESFLAVGLAPPEPTVRADSIRTLARMAVAGAGLAFVPLLAVEDELAQGTLAQLAWPGTPIAVPLNFIRRRGAFLHQGVSTFIAFALSQGVRSGDDRLRHAVSSPS